MKFLLAMSVFLTTRFFIQINIYISLSQRLSKISTSSMSSTELDRDRDRFEVYID